VRVSNPTHFEVAEAFFAAVDKLKNLPEDPEQIAVELEQHGVKGHCGNAWHCALAKYVLRDVDIDPETLTVEIMGDTLVFIYQDEISLVWDLPPGLHKFTQLFDEKRFPNLILPGIGPHV
jgi:hypothetical protein